MQLDDDQKKMIKARARAYRMTAQDVLEEVLELGFAAQHRKHDPWANRAGLGPHESLPDDLAGTGQVGQVQLVSSDQKGNILDAPRKRRRRLF